MGLAIDGIGSVHPLRGMAKQNRYADKAQNQAEIGGRVIRCPLGGKGIRQLAARLDDLLAENGGQPPAHWQELNGVVAAVIRAKGLL
jgi:hypothetical protein